MQYTYFILCAFVFSLTLNIIYFNKKHVLSGETKLFSIMLFTNLLGLASEFICSYIGYNFQVNSLISHIATKIYLIYLLTFLLLMTLYIYVICYVTNKRRQYNHYYFLRKLSLIIYAVGVLIMLFLPIKTYAGYANGPAVSYVYIWSTICLLIWMIPFFKNRKSINLKKLIPTLWFVIFLFAVSIIQKIVPNVTLTTAMEFLVIFIMYHTIENPDINMIEQLKQNKILIERGNEDKSNFLFKMSQEVKKPIDDIIRISNISLNSNDIETKNQGIKYIEANAKKLKVLVNDVLDVSKMDAYNIKMIDSTYNIYNVFTEIFTRYESIIEEKLEFRHSISKNIPKILYGDSVKLKQVVTTILQNAVDHTKQGFIDVNVDSIIKNDVCRLIISIEDSGCGMSLDKVNELLSLSSDLTEEDITKLDKMNLDLNIATKIIRLLGGQIIIKSEVNVGSEFIITLEQRIEKNSNDINLSKKIDEYSMFSSNKKRVLIVNDKKDELDNISNYLEKRNIDTVKVMYGQDCVDRINNKQKYDLILLEDEMIPLTGINTLQKLQQIPHFKIPVIIMLDKNKEAIKEHYINDGFRDYLLKENIDNELNRIIKKYL